MQRLLFLDNEFLGNTLQIWHILRHEDFTSNILHPNFAKLSEEAEKVSSNK